MNIVENPYMTRRPVKDPDGFYGRHEIMKRIFGDIVRRQMQSQFIIGEVRIGKTSLLHQIMHRTVREKYIKNDEPFIFIRTHIPLFPDASPADFFNKWIEDISRTTHQEISKEPGYLTFRKFVEETTDAGYKTIILLDEFEAVTLNEKLDKGFFEFLRALTQNYNISFILFSRTPLQYFLKMEQFSSIFSSPFFNAIDISYLRFLQEKEAESLVCEPAQKVGVDIADFTDFILERTYYHPFLIQLLSSIVFDHKRSSDTNEEKILKEFNIQTEEFFTYLWQHSNMNEQEALKKLTSQDQDIPKSVISDLDRRSLLTEDRNKIFCPAFEEFVKTQI